MIATTLLIADLQRVNVERGRATALPYRQHGRYGHTTILRRFGSWRAALSAAGLSSRPCGRPAGKPRTEAERRRDQQRSIARECLRCERAFRSKVNRICPDCKRHEAWQEGSL